MIDALKKVSSGADLTVEEAESAMKAIMAGQVTPVQAAGFLVALKMKGESASEISSFAKVMREYSIRIEPKVKGTLIDMCGTGGDSSGTFNISTAAMFVVAGCGIPVAKHGNRSITSKCGSADVLEALGARIDLPPERIRSCIEDVGVGFMFAPNHHPAMKNVGPIRKELGVRTVFNILGPLTNPANAKAQLMGVFDPSLTETLAEVFRLLGLQAAMVVHGQPGLDELSTIGQTKISHLAKGKVRTYHLDPKTLGFKAASIEDIKGGSAQENAQLIRGILSGDIQGPRRDIVLLNAAAGIMVGGLKDGFKGALELAADSIDSGKALYKLDDFIAFTGG